MARSIGELLADIDAAVTADAMRKQAHDAVLSAAGAFADSLPLVHRTGRPGATTRWPDVLTERVLRVSPTITPEEVACGCANAVYFFLGCAAYPHGGVAFVMEREITAAATSTFSAFDSGGLHSGLILFLGSAAWSEDDRARCLAQHSGNAADVATFAGRYLAAHFREPSEYTSRDQESMPDFEPYHQLRSTTGDRRAWSIEVRIEGDVAVEPDRDRLRGIVLANRALEADVPDDFYQHVVIAESDGDSDGDVAVATARLVLAAMREQSL
jgi:hypothetical protein